VRYCPGDFLANSCRRLRPPRANDLVKPTERYEEPAPPYCVSAHDRPRRFSASRAGAIALRASQACPASGSSVVSRTVAGVSWDADLDLMEKAHINFVRVGEFAWSTMEPREGDFELDWLYRAVRSAERHGIAVVIGTPSAAPPAWLTTQFPETLRTRQDGSKDGHGGRQQFDWSDPKYRELAHTMAEKLASGSATILM
jgi:Beta-galactosidase